MTHCKCSTQLKLCVLRVCPVITSFSQGAALSYAFPRNYTLSEHAEE